MQVARLGRWGLLALVMLALSGCAVRLAYNQLDWLIPWYVDDYLALNASQEKAFRRSLEDYLDWHRREQLPQYARFLRRLSGQAADGLDDAELAELQADTERFTRALIGRLGPVVHTVLANATDAQVARLYAKFDEDNLEFFETYIDVPEEEQREQAADKARRQVERWTGRLDRKQRQMIERWSQSYPLMSSDWLDARRRWQQALAASLSQRQEDPVRFRRELQALMDNTALGRSEAFQAKIDKSRQLFLVLYHRLDDSLSERQRKRVVDTLKAYADDFESLAKE